MLQDKLTLSLSGSFLVLQAALKSYSLQARYKYPEAYVRESEHTGSLFQAVRKANTSLGTNSMELNSTRELPSC
jgi:hypothetical protein